MNVKDMRKVLLIMTLLLTMVAQGAWADGTIDITPSDKNKVLCTDGSIYNSVLAAEADSKTPVAKIIVVDTENHKGLALALSDEGQMNYSNALTACDDKNTLTPVTNATWAIPSKDEWDQMLSAAGSYTALRDGFSGIGGTNISNANQEVYWSRTKNTEQPNLVNWTYRFDDINSGWTSSDQGGTEVHVRLCLQFNIPIPTHNATLADGTPTGWSITPTTPEEGSTVTVAYTGQHRVKSVRVKGIAKLTCDNTAISFAKADVVNSTKTKTGVSAFGGTVSVSSSNTSNCTVSYADGTITITRKNANAFSGTQITVSVTPNDDNFVWKTANNVTFTVSGAAHVAGDVESVTMGTYQCAKLYTSATSGFYIMCSDYNSPTDAYTAENYSVSAGGKTFTCGYKYQWESILQTCGGHNNYGYSYINTKCASITGWNNLSGEYWTRTSHDSWPFMYYYFNQTGWGFEDNPIGKNVRLIATF